MATTVSVFVDMPKRGTTLGHRTADYYIQKGQYLLSHRIPLILFIEPDHVQTITELRQELIGDDYVQLTQIIPFDIEESNIYRKYYDIDAHYESKKLYTFITWVKFELMARAITLNPFNTEHFHWCDFGIRHILPDHTIAVCSENLQKTSSKIKLLCLQPPRSEIVYGPHRYTLAAGYITGNIAHWRQLTHLFQEQIPRCLEAGWGELEEALLENIYIEHHELFEFYFGFYVNVLSNYDCPMFDLQRLKDSYRQDNHANNYHLYHYIAPSLHKFDPDFIFTLLTGAYFAHWYGFNGKYREECANIAEQLLHWSQIDPVIEDKLVKNFDLWDSNFSFLSKFERSMKAEKFDPTDPQTQYILTVPADRKIHVSYRFCISNPRFVHAE